MGEAQLAVFAIGVLTFLCVVLAVLVVLSPRDASLQERLVRYSVMPVSGGLTPTLDAPLVVRLFGPMARGLASFLVHLTPGGLSEEQEAQLRRAGYPLGLSPSAFLLAKAVVLLALPGSYLLFLVMSRAVNAFTLAIGAVVLYLAVRGPALWLENQVEARKRRIVRALPDALDLLVICVESGLGFEGAMSRVAETTKGPLAEELRRTLSEMSLGTRRRDALRALAQRCDVPELSSFVAMVVQAEQTGVGIGQVLKVQADAMRVRRHQLAQEEGRKAPLKMLFPLMFFILPATFAVILGPALLRVIASLTALR